MVVIEFDEKYIDQIVDLVDEYRSFYSFERTPDKTREFILGFSRKGG